jgi:nucleotide-binding universal stress UspA family protein
MDASTTQASRPRIVVGYDGSEAARRALEEAAARAGAEGHLYVVHCFHAPGDQYGVPNDQAQMTDEMREAKRLLDDIASSHGDALATGRWESELIGGHAADAIVRVASVRDADAIYIGTRGVGRARGLLGSVAHDVLHKADRPVVVIPERAVRPAEPAAT